MELLDQQIRLAAFQWLQKVTDVQGDVLSRDLLSNGFYFSDTRIPLVAPVGIFKPRQMQFPLSITSAPDKPSNINHIDNVGLRRAGEFSISFNHYLKIVESHEE